MCANPPSRRPDILRQEGVINAMLDSLPGIVYIIDAQGRLLRWNKNLERVSGYCADEISRLTPADFVDQPDQATVAEKMKQAFVTGEATAELDIVARDGTKTPYYLTGRRVEIDRQPCLIGMGIDISRRRRAEEALSRDEERFRIALGAANTAVFSQDLDLRYTWMYQPQLGYSSDQVIGKTDAELLPAQDAPVVMDIKRRVIRTGRRERAEVPIHVDGEIAYYDLIVVPVLDKAGAVIGITGSSRDITQRKRAELELQRFRLAIDASPDSIYLTDPATMRFVDVNSAACRRLGYSREELLGMGPQDVLGRDAAQIKREYDDVIAAGEDGVRTESGFVTSDGTRGWTELHRRAFRVAGGLLVVSVGRDITARKRAEESLRRSEEQVRMIADNVPAMIAYIDRDARYRFVNRRYAEFYDLPVERFVGQPVRAILGEDAWQGLRPSLERVMAGESLSIERRHRRSDRLVRDLAIELVPDRDASANVQGVYGLVLDVTERRRAEQALRDREAQLSLIADHVPAMIAYVDTDRRYHYANRRYREFYVPPGEGIEGRTMQDVLDPDTTRDAHPLFERAFAGETVSYQASRRRRDGRRRIVDVSLVPHRDASGRVLGLYVLVIDVTRRHRAERMLQLRNRAIEASVNSVMITEPTAEGQRIVYVNPAFERITGYSAAEVLGRSPRFLYGNDGSQPEVEALRAAQREKREATALLRNYRRDGTLFWNELRIAPVPDESGRIAHFICVGSDVTDRVRYEGEIERNANYDALTGLPNRNLLDDRLAQAVANVERTKSPAAVLYIDLDQFKRINDSLGHAVGDQVITATSARLAGVLRGGDTVARWGGDEFVAVLTNLSHEDDVTHVAEKLRHAVAAPLAIEGHEFVLSASVGIALAPKDGTSGPMLLRNADAALYRAKAEGRDCFRFFASEMNEHAVRYLTLEHDLRVALDSGEFRLQYQPIVRLATRIAVGVEALMCWRRPDGSVVPPADFIPVAEESGLIVPIGRWVLDTAARQAAAWNRGREPPLYVSVNLSARQFRDPGLLEAIRAAIEAAKLDPSLLNLEITESTVMHNAEDAARTLQGLKDLGVQLSVDDFGTGYSSLSYLKRFPIDTLKIDRSFVRDLPENRDDLAICRAVIDLAQGLGLDVIAEGIETVEQAAMLSTHSCEFAQGFLFSRPLDPGALDGIARSPGHVLPAPAPEG